MNENRGEEKAVNVLLDCSMAKKVMMVAKWPRKTYDERDIVICPWKNIYRRDGQSDDNLDRYNVLKSTSVLKRERERRHDRVDRLSTPKLNMKRRSEQLSFYGTSKLINLNESLRN